MFKKLKDKIAEEVKSSPQRIQQIAQAVVSSASSTSSEVSGGNDTFFSIAEEDTPQNSPQHANVNNHQHQTAIQTSTPVSVTNSSNARTPISSSSSSLAGVNHNDSAQQNGGGGGNTHNTSNSSSVANNMTARRKLSTSSMGSDVSFRLPSYDSPAVYHLQSDLDISASEVEDHGITAHIAQLDRVSKDQLHQAYRKSLDKYQKYRRRYTDLARKYGELERENSKARSVLVETQDKALRRISELREQCSLEQQAKAHLEAALRMELDDKDCLIQSLKTKLDSEFDDSLMTTSNRSSNLSNNSTSNNNNNAAVLIDLTTPHTTSIDSLEDNNQANTIQQLENELAKYKTDLEKQAASNAALETKLTALQSDLADKTQTAKQLQDKLQSLVDIKLNYDAKVIESEHHKATVKDLEAKLTQKDEEFRKLKACEEENVLLMAESKQDMHKELENRENEVKLLTKKLSDLEKAASDNLALNEKFIQLEVLLGKEKSEYGNRIKELKTRNAELTKQVQDLEECCKKSEDVKIKTAKELQVKNDKISDLLAELDAMRKDKLAAEQCLSKTTRELNESANKITSLDWSIKQLETERVALIKKCDIITKENQILTDTKEKLKNASETLLSEKERAQNEYAILQSKYADVERNSGQLRKELEILNACKDSTESETNRKLQTELKTMREKLLDAEKVCQDLQQNCALLETEKTNKDFEIQNIRAAVMVLKETLSDDDNSAGGQENDKNDKEIEKCTVRELEDKIIDVINSLKQKRDVEKQNRERLTSERQKREAVFENDLTKLQSELCAVRDERAKISEQLLAVRQELKVSEDAHKDEVTKLNEQLRETEERWRDVQTRSERIELKLKETEGKLAKAEGETESWKLKHEQLAEKFERVLCDTTGELNLAREGIERLHADYKIAETRLQSKIAECELQLERLGREKTQVLQGTSEELQAALGKIDDLQKRLENAETELTRANNDAESWKLKNEDLTEKCEKLSKDLEERTLGANNSEVELNARIESLSKEKDALEKLAGDLQTTKDRQETEYQEKLTLLQNESGELRQQCDDTRREFADLQRAHDTLQNQSAILRQNNVELTGKVENLEKSQKDTENELVMYRARAQTWQESEAEKEYLNTVIIQLESDVSKMTREKADLETRMNESRADLESKVNSVNTLTHELRKQRERYEKRVLNLESSLNEKNETNHGLRKTVSGLEKESSEARSLAEDLRAKMHALEVTNAGLLKQLEATAVDNKKLVELAGHANKDALSRQAELEKLQQRLAGYEEKQKRFETALSENEKMKRSLKESQRLLEEAQNNGTLGSSAAKHSEELERLQKANEKLKDEKQYLDKMLSDAEQKSASKDDELKLLRDELKRAETELQEVGGLKERVQELEAVNHAQCRELNDQISAENAELRDKLTRCTQSLSELSELKANYERYGHENKELLDKLSRLEEKYDNSERSIDSKISNLNQEIDCHIERIRYLEEKCKDYDQVKRANVELNRETQQLTKKLSEYEMTNEDNDGLDNRLMMGDRASVGCNYREDDKNATNETARGGRNGGNGGNSAAIANDEEDEAEKRDLEEKLGLIINEVTEVSNKNLVLEQRCQNMRLLEQTNEKLRLANEKLSRQLDETLVTRRHSESITQLTEFEYLRNVLYQYLSGGSGSGAPGGSGGSGGALAASASANSTLVRVIAAVMKFDAAQTRTVLDKEAQKNTLLGQLHLI